MKVVLIERLAKYGKKDNKPIRDEYVERPIIIRNKNNKLTPKLQLNEPTNTDKCRATVTACHKRQQMCACTKHTH